jgi:hypothetical protein
MDEKPEEKPIASIANDEPCPYRLGSILHNPTQYEQAWP